MPIVAAKGLRISGINKLRLTLAGLDDKVKRKVVISSLMAAASPIVTAGRQNARRRKETADVKHWRKVRAKAGLAQYRLAETIGKASRRYKGRGMVVIGPIYGRKYGHKGNIGHLVEEGHRKFLFGHDTGQTVPGKPYMKPAWDATIKKAKRILQVKIAAGIEREAAKARVR